MELISGGVGPNEDVKIRVEGDNLVVKRNHEIADTPLAAPAAEMNKHEDLD